MLLKVRLTPLSVVCSKSLQCFDHASKYNVTDYYLVKGFYLLGQSIVIEEFVETFWNNCIILHFKIINI